jgi:hypothetical protein
MKSKIRPTYQLRFFFDYNCGGCLWCANDASYKTFDVGCLDSALFDLYGHVIEEAKIRLPETIAQEVLKLDMLYSESLNWDDPAGPSLWNKEQWNEFYKQARLLDKDVSIALGDDFELLYEVEKYERF